jgi:hypothetical protein
MADWLVMLSGTSASTVLPEYHQLTVNPPHELCGMSINEYLQSLDHFRLSLRASQMEVRQPVLSWFMSQGHRFEHHVLTARPRTTVSAAAEWVFSRLGTWVRHFHFVPAVRADDPLPDSGDSKSRVISSIGGSDYFVDDLESNISQSQHLVRHCLTVPQPWNRQSLSLVDVLNQIH